MITIHAYLNGEYLNSYWADGIMISTPTGSTGYSLSCGGPIVVPQSESLVITPIAPHNLNVRPIVVSDKNVISLEVEGRSQRFMATLGFAFCHHRFRIPISNPKGELLHQSDSSQQRKLPEYTAKKTQLGP